MNAVSFHCAFFPSPHWTRNLFLFSNLFCTYRNNKKTGLINEEFKRLMQSVFTKNFGKIAVWMEETRLSLQSTSRSPCFRDWLTPAPLKPPASFPVWLWRPLANIHAPSTRDDKMAYILTRQRLMKPFRIIYWNTSKDLALRAPPSMSRCKKSNICLISASVSNYFLEAFFPPVILCTWRQSLWQCCL